MSVIHLRDKSVKIGVLRAVFVTDKIGYLWLSVRACVCARERVCVCVCLGGGGVMYFRCMYVNARRISIACILMFQCVDCK